MKTCPYCAEEIQDAAIKCRYCQSWLVDEVPAGAETPPQARVVEEPEVEAETTSVVEAPEETAEVVAEPEPIEAAEAVEPPEEVQAETSEPEVTEETRLAEVSTPVVAAAAATAPEAIATPTTTPEVTPAPEAAPPAEPQPEWTHSGERYLLGYTDAYFGIWDRQTPAAPMERFPRTDDGWRQAWQRYASVEHHWMDLRTGQRSS